MSLLKQSISSDYDYLKIALDNSITMNANGTPDSDSTFPNDPDGPTYVSKTSITHGLGSIPMVRAFWDPEKNGVWVSSGFFFSHSAYLKIHATSSVVKLMMGASTTQTDIPVYYRIYDFGDKATDSDSRVDKVFMVGTDSKAIPAAADRFTPGEATITIPHGQDSAPIWTLQFSESASGPWYGEGLNITGDPDTTTGPPGGPYAYYKYLKAYGTMDDTNFYINLENGWYVGKTLYVRFALDYRE